MTTPETTAKNAMLRSLRAAEAAGSCSPTLQDLARTGAACLGLAESDEQSLALAWDVIDEFDGSWIVD